jgi:hypothetical protein
LYLFNCSKTEKEEEEGEGDREEEIPPKNGNYLLTPWTDFHANIFHLFIHLGYGGLTNCIHT